MDAIREALVMGRARRVFKCDCGAEIFFVKDGQNFVKYVAPPAEEENEDHAARLVHQCNAVRKYNKTCYQCKKDIKLWRDGNIWVKENYDGTVHVCDNNKKLTPENATRVKDELRDDYPDLHHHKHRDETRVCYACPNVFCKECTPETGDWDSSFCGCIGRRPDLT